MPLLSDAIQWAGWLWRGVAVWDKLTSRPQRGRFRQQAEFVLWASNGRLPVDRPVPALQGVFKAVNVQGIERIHQTQKPLDVMRGIVKICLPGGRILDPFAGTGVRRRLWRKRGGRSVGNRKERPRGRDYASSPEPGTTLAAAQAEGYDAIGVEISAPIATLAAERLNTPLRQL